MAIDCSLLGLECIETSDSGEVPINTMCGVSQCTPAQGNFENKCNGDTAETCVLGVKLTTDCGFLGMTCNPDATDIDKVCKDVVMECKEEGEYCDGDSAVSCYEGKGSSMNCKVFGDNFTCITYSDPDFPDEKFSTCAIEDYECIQGKDKPVCNGDSLKVCVVGKWIEIDCKKIGFNTCATKEKEGVSYSVCE